MPFTAARAEPRKTEDTHSLAFRNNCKLRVQSEVAVSWAGSKRTGGSPSPQHEKSHHLGKDTHKRSAGELEAGRSWEVIAVEAPTFCRAGANSRPPPWQGHWGGAGKRPGRNSAAVTSARAGRALPPGSFEGSQSPKGWGPEDGAPGPRVSSRQSASPRTEMSKAPALAPTESEPTELC